MAVFPPLGSTLCGGLKKFYHLDKILNYRIAGFKNARGGPTIPRLKYTSKFSHLSIFSIFMKSSVDGLRVWAYNPAIERERRRFWRPTNSL